MTNYNDGNWHGWNGGECPVHPDTVVEVRNLAPYLGRNEQPMKASAFIWTGDNAGADIIAFRVIKEHKKPREFWFWNGKVFINEDCAMREFVQDTSHDRSLRNYRPPFKVREVLE